MAKLNVKLAPDDWGKAPPEIVAESKNLSILLYGTTGSQKTRIAASAALVKEMSPAYLLDVDLGSESVNWKIPQRRILSIEDLGKGLTEALSGKYKTIILDSATELYHKLYLPAAVQYALADKRREHDPELPEQRDYLRAHGKFKELMRLLKDSGTNFIVTAQETYVYDAQDKDILLGVGPSISGKLNTEVGQFFALVGRTLTNREGVTEVNFKPEFRVMSKDRKNLIPDVLVIEDAREAMDAIYHYYKKGGK